MVHKFTIYGTDAALTTFQLITAVVLLQQSDSPVPSIKYVREKARIGLKEAKYLVEYLRDNAQIDEVTGVVTLEMSPVQYHGCVDTRPEESSVFDQASDWVDRNLPVTNLGELLRRKLED